MGRRNQGGAKRQDSQAVFATVGLAVEWFKTKPSSWLANYAAIFLDEIDQVETDLAYAVLWEKCCEEAKRRKFHIIGASATFSEALKARLAEQDVGWVRCDERPYSLEQYYVTVPSRTVLYDGIAYTVIKLLGRGEKILVFLPGKAEIEWVTAWLKSKDPNLAKMIFPLHSDLCEDAKGKALAQKSGAFVVLATSIAETSITIPDISHVIDAGLCRLVERNLGIVESGDSLSLSLSLCDRVR
jgi:ATP-dependent helicase HrpB